MTVSISIEACRAAPTIMWNHIDGPLLEWACYCHWLTYRERIAMYFGWADAESIARKHWPARAKWATPTPACSRRAM